MPIYEYVCVDCNGSFEKLVERDEAVACPACNGSHLEKQYSRFGFNTGTSSQSYPSLPLYKSGGGCGCNPGGCGCRG